MTRHLSYANVAATLSLVVVLTGGVAMASGGLQPNSVGTRQLKNNAVVGKKVKDGSLSTADFAAGQLPAGPPGPKGNTGDPGNPGANAAAFLGVFPITITIGAGVCTGFNFVDGAIKVGDSILLQADYALTAPNAISANGGIATVAGSVPTTFCNNSTSGAPLTDVKFAVWRLVGPAGRPAPGARPGGRAGFTVSR
jgi:hypothetical protein